MPSRPLGLVVLGSTGSIGASTLDVVKNLGPDRVKVVGLAAGTKWEKLAEQARALRPLYVSAARGEPVARLRDAVGDICRVLEGEEGQRAMVAAPECTAVLAAVTGAAGLPAVVEAARTGKRLCLSNKESLVVAGPIVRRLARESGAPLLPVDSEHSAIFQCLRSGQAPQEVKRIILTASGGPFRTWSAERISRCTLDEALNHPTWKMGPNITIDSATLMNKALEVIEAHWLFDLPAERIETICHPQSIVHSMVEFVDGSVMAQMGVPDMRVPIQYALTYPERAPLPVATFDLARTGKLEFEAIDHDRFPSIQLAYTVLRKGAAGGAVLNAANEVARGAFLERAIPFDDIARTNARVLARYYDGGGPAPVPAPSLEGVLEADRWARQEATRCLKQPS
ncbi:MAG TPA: 1-deoxy-D-xylulose-5-phosphate reductoisomerase [Planctomycetota bacterium]|nr:1-deoxy-D-xylulose-5-phosphate reductoisomerase [Planctomycetota bacterium]